MQTRLLGEETRRLPAFLHCGCPEIEHEEQQTEERDDECCDFCKDVLIGKRLRNTGELIINEQLRNMEDCD